MDSSESHFETALQQIENIIKFKKCWRCGCSQGAIKGLEKELDKIPSADRVRLTPLLERAKETFVPIEYDCLGCKTCFPGDLGNALSQAYPALELEPDSCAADNIIVEKRDGYPPFPGNYELVRYHAPVAVCTLNSQELITKIAKTSHPALSIVGSLNTENLGIERVIQNTIANPHIRHLILCGEDSEQKIGHLPGQSFLSLVQNGVDSESRIVGAKGRRPVLKNINSDELRQFREQVEVIDLIGSVLPEEILEIAARCREQKKGPFSGGQAMKNRAEPIEAKEAKPLLLDPKGYFVIFPVQDSSKIVVEHYLNSGVLNQIIEGADIGAIYSTIIDLGLISKLDHAAYLGKELTRAAESLRMGTSYQQDKAQDSSTENKLPSASCSGKGCC